MEKKRDRTKEKFGRFCSKRGDFLNCCPGQRDCWVVTKPEAVPVEACGQGGVGEA